MFLQRPGGPQSVNSRLFPNKARAFSPVHGVVSLRRPISRQSHGALSTFFVATHLRTFIQVAIVACASQRSSEVRAAALEVTAEARGTLLSYSFQSEYEQSMQGTLGPPVKVKATGNIIAIGDIHGDLGKALACLELAGVLAAEDGRVSWIGGDTTVVQLGDVLDRGDSEISTILLLRELDRQARLVGGAVYMLNGNHESLNVAGDFRYVTPGAFVESAAAAGLPEDVIRSDRNAVLNARWMLYRPGGQMAKELAKNPAVLIVNEIVFAHGGLLPQHLMYGLQRLNDEVAAWMLGCQKEDGSNATPPFPAMGDSNSVMWNRTFGKERVSDYDRLHMRTQLDQTLKKLGAKAMVVGHTPQMGGLNCECDGRVWRVDAGMSSGVLGAQPQVLEFSKTGKGALMARMLCLQGDQVLSSPPFVYEDMIDECV